MKNSSPLQNLMDDSCPSNQDENCNVKPIDQLQNAGCNGSYETDAYAFLKESDILPRIGDEFQAEIPPLSDEFDCNFLVGLPVPCFTLKHEVLSGGSVKNENSLERKDFETIYWVPGLRTNEWSDAEKGSFLLGLYIFQKDFVEVKRFVETKEMGAILSFYYGEFYGSDVYNRWSDGQKKKSKKSVYGQRIFSGPRQQELLSRLRTRTSEQQHDALLEVLKRFSDEKTSLAECVSSLKAMVGTSILVETIGIGTGKRDLTGMALEPLRYNRTVTARPNIPTGKDCSTLTPSEIIKFISGNYRLSKNKSSDLFWEAVWPRLLARGWHSEQPRDQVLNNGLVFVVPGVTKFSRKLVRGEHYFDSVSDVLNKVGREPDLIELNEDDDSEKKIEVLANERESEKDDDDSPARKRRSYLQPRTTNWDDNGISFVVVDTSLRGGKIRELRSLPTEVLISVTSKSRTNYSCKEEVDESETRKKSGEKRKLKEGTYPDFSNLKREKASHKEKHLKKVPSKKMKCTNEGRVAPLITKITGKAKAGPRFENGISSCTSSIRVFPENITSQASSYQDKMSSANSQKGSPSESVEFASIDLNVPQMPIELENSFVATESSKGQESKITSAIEPKTKEAPVANSRGQETKIASAIEAKAIEVPFVSSRMQESKIASTIEAKTSKAPVNSRRQSTRTREPTTKALEAVADGYLVINKRKKSKEGETFDRPSRRARGVPSGSTNSLASHQTEEAENVSKSDDNSNFGEANGGIWFETGSNGQ